MDRLNQLRSLNPELDIRAVSDPAFTAYGRVLAGVDAGREVEVARKLPIPAGVTYDAIVPELEAAGDLLSYLEINYYGDMPAQLGWCYGHNLSLDGLEYHKGNEINVAVTDCAVMLAQYNDICWEPQPSLDSSLVKTFYIPAGTVFEFYSWGLHFAPIHVSEHEGFCILVTLPRETNFALARKPQPVGEAALLFGRNKWLLVHPDAEGLVRDGAYIGIRGKNLKLRIE